MNLNYKEFGNGEPILILHGLFGSLDNWQTIAKQLATDNRVFIIDQRNHGRSSHSTEHSYELMAEDLGKFCLSLNLEKVTVIGHSMGGKTAMQFAIDNPALCQQFISMDMAPKAYGSGHDLVFEALMGLDMDSLGSRKEAESEMAHSIVDPGVLLFLLKNLSRKPDGTFEWKMNIQSLYDNYPEITKAIESDFPVSIPCLFVKGANSEYITADDEDEVLNLFPLAEFVEVTNAGHWVHTENPEQLIKVIRDFIS